MKSLKKKPVISYPYSEETSLGKVKIYRTTLKGSAFYRVVYKTAEGRQEKTFANEADAHARFEEIVEDRKKGVLARNSITTMEAVQLEEWKRVLAEKGATLGDAVRVYLEWSSKESVIPIMAADAVQKYLDTFQQKEKLHYINSKHIMNAFARAFGKRMDKITKNEIQTYCEMYKATKTRNNHLNKLRTFFRWAQEENFVPKGKLVTDLVKTFKPTPEEEQEKPTFEIIFTAEELEKILNHTQNDAVPAVAIGAFAGIRTAEVCRLTWEDINLERKTIQVKKSASKTKSRRLLTISDNLVKWIDTFKGKREGRIVGIGKNWIFKRRADALEKAGIEKWKRNGLRKGYISARMANADANSFSVSKYCGNSPQILESEYKELIDPVDAEALLSIAPKETLK